VWERRFRGGESVILPPVEQVVVAPIQEAPATIPVESVLVR
jgi:hypothetical protein